MSCSTIRSTPACRTSCVKFCNARGAHESARLFLLMCIQRGHAALELESKHGGGSTDCQKICHGFSQENSKRLIGKEMRQDINEWDQQEDFAQSGKEQGGFGIAKSHKGLLASDLDAEKTRGAHIDAQRPYGVVHQ